MPFRSVTGSGGGTETGLGADKLVGEGITLLVGAHAAVEPGHHDDHQERQRHGKQRRVVIREDRVSMTEHSDPDRWREDHQHQRANQAGKNRR